MLQWKLQTEGDLEQNPCQQGLVTHYYADDEFVLAKPRACWVNPQPSWMNYDSCRVHLEKTLPVEADACYSNLTCADWLLVAVAAVVVCGEET